MGTALFVTSNLFPDKATVRVLYRSRLDATCTVSNYKALQIATFSATVQYSQLEAQLVYLKQIATVSLLLQCRNKASTLFHFQSRILSWESSTPMSLSAVNFLNKTSCSRNRRVSDADIDSGITCRDPNTRWETSATTSVLPPVSLSERLLDLACRDETFQAVSCMSCAVFNSYILLAGVQPYALIMIVGFFATFLFGLLLNLYIQCDQDTALDSQVLLLPSQKFSFAANLVLSCPPTCERRDYCG